MSAKTLAAVAALALAPAAVAQSPFRTVFVIVMENHDWSAIRGNPMAPYINNQLLPVASHAEAYFNPPGVHPSLPNYLWMEAGTDFGIRDDHSPSTHSFNADHLVAQLTRAGISWKTYAEDIDGTSCPVANMGNYAVRHVPMVYFGDIAPGGTDATSAVCIAHIRPYSELASDLQNNTVASYNFIVPNKCDDMHSCGVDAGDAWLSKAVPPIVNSQAFQNGGVLFLTWDEGSGKSDGPIGMIVVSPYAKSNGYANSIPYTHASLLRTVQTIFGVGPLLGGAASATDLSDLFAVGLNARGAAAQVANAASYAGGSVAPGEVVGLFGTGIGPATPLGMVVNGSQVASSMGGFRVLFDSVAAPLLYAGPNQVNLVVPFEVAGKTTSEVQIEGGGRMSAPLSLAIAPTAPGIFTLDQSGKGAAVVTNQDGRLNSPTAPAAPGSIIHLFATGAGQTNPPSVTGQLAGSAPAPPLEQVSVSIGGDLSQVMYAGPAPGLVSGILQVNVLISSDTPTGAAIPIVLTVGGVSSQPGVTVSIGP